MLSDYQVKLVWEGMLGAETRAAYFGELSHRLLARQKWLTLASLLLSSGAGVALITSAVPAHLGWIKPAMAFLAAGIGLWSLVARNDRGSIDAADLHSRWLTVALSYEAIWEDVTQEDALEQLRVCQMREAELSKSSTSLPDIARLMVKAQDLVIMHRVPKEQIT